MTPWVDGAKIISPHNTLRDNAASLMAWGKCTCKIFIQNLVCGEIEHSSEHTHCICVTLPAANQAQIQKGNLMNPKGLQVLGKLCGRVGPWGRNPRCWAHWTAALWIQDYQQTNPLHPKPWWYHLHIRNSLRIKLGGCIQCSLLTTALAKRRKPVMTYPMTKCENPGQASIP